MPKVVIEETKQLGYNFVQSQNSSRFGFDIEKYQASKAEDFDLGTYVPKYKSVNAKEIANDYEEESDNEFPLDEEGAVPVIKSETYKYTLAEFTYNKNNPVHVYLNTASKVSDMRKNIPFAYIDFTDNTQTTGLCNLTIKTNTVGGETRKLEVEVNVIGKPNSEPIPST